jgi:hypothetical protein
LAEVGNKPQETLIMTFALIVIIAILIAIVLIVVAPWKDPKNNILTMVEQIRTSTWQGWIEIAINDHTDYKPFFQGKIVAMDSDHGGALLFGVLVEENTPAALLSVIKARPFTYLTEGRLLMRGLTSHHKKVIMTKLDDQELIEQLRAVMNQGVKPDTALVLNSIDIQHMDTEESMARFERIWEASQAKPAESCSDAER